MPTKGLTDKDKQIISAALAETKGGIRPAWRLLRARGHKYSHGTIVNVSRGRTGAARAVDPRDPLTRSEIIKLLRKGWVNIGALADEWHCPQHGLDAAVKHLASSGYNVIHDGDRARIVRDTPTGGEKFVDASPLKGKRKTFGIISDTHLCSTYQRLDVLEAAYDEFARAGVKYVYHAGNIVDGHTHFNRFELKCHGITDQAHYVLDHYPQRSGITTRFITGCCHEGWWFGREGMDFGRYLMFEAENVGRKDLQFLAHGEADIEFKAKGGSAIMKIIHPAAGTAYAISYQPQKIVECVPLNSEILTRRGWRKRGELEVGEEVLGYNTSLGLCQWTPLLAVNGGRGEVVTYKNDNYVVRCTRDHKWVVESEARAGPNPNSKSPEPYSRESRSLSPIDPLVGGWKRHRIVQAAPAPSGPGWNPRSHAEWLGRDSAVEAVLAMTTQQRRAFVYGLMLGEGTVIEKSGTLVFSQRPGPVNDAFALACFLEGIAPGMARTVAKKVSGEEKVCARTTMLRKPRRMLASMQEVGSTEEEVWCPTTALGTWVMRQDNVITITGNSLQGGEKPGILVVGHFHKLEHTVPRNVHVLQAGCCQDQSRWMRSRHIEAHVGWMLVTIQQDARGAVRRCLAEITNYFDRGYHITGTG